MRTWLIIGAVLLGIAPACKTKHQATQERRTNAELVASGRTEAVQLYTRATEAVTRLAESDSLHIIIKDYRADGSLARVTELMQGHKREQTDNTKTQDSLKATQLGEENIKAEEFTTETHKVSTDAKPSLGIPWWLVVIGVVVVGIFVALGILKKKLL